MNSILFYHPSMKALAQRIDKGSSDVDLGNIVWHNFADGSPDVFINDVKGIRGKDVAFLASFEEPEQIFAQFGVIYALPRYGARSFTLLLPYLPTATKERVDVDGEIATAKTLARMISAIPPCFGSGPAQVVIYDIHATGEWFYFGDSVLVRLESAIPLLHKKLEQIPNVVVAFPDDGARKRFGQMFSSYEQIVCQKKRDGKKRYVTIASGKPVGKHVVIIDDLCRSGGTLIACKKALEAAGADKVSAFFSHSPCTKEVLRKLMEAGFIYIWTTDSCRVAQTPSHSPYEYISLAEPLTKIITEI